MPGPSSLTIVHTACVRPSVALTALVNVMKKLSFVSPIRSPMMGTKMNCVRFVVPAPNIWHCDPNVPLEIYAIFDPLGNAAHTALSYDLVGEDVLITGAGPIGVSAVPMAIKAGARFVVVTDVNDYRLGLADKLGATAVVNVANQDLHALPLEEHVAPDLHSQFCVQPLKRQLSGLIHNVRSDNVVRFDIHASERREHGRFIGRKHCVGIFVP